MTARNAVLLVLLSAGSLLAQSTEASIVGVVRDSSGALMPGVTVTAVSRGTNIATSRQSSESGNYEIPALPPGEYNLTAEVQGFKKQVLTGIILQVNQVARFDIAMQVGDVVEQVTVESRAPLVVTETGAIGQVIDNRKIVDLPLNGRNFTQLATLTPGVTPSGAMGTGRASSVFVSGSRATKTEFLLDGVSATGPINGGTGVLPSIDALQEFKLQTSAFAAEFGRSPSLVNISIKSGTNHFHGSVFEFVRNDVFDARNTFALSNPPLKRNQFGFTAGGPIRKNDFFFFGNYEGNRQRRGLTYNAQLATMAQRQGNFAGAAPIFDPATTRPNPAGTGFVRDPFPGNAIPSNRIVSQAAYFLPFFPEPNTADGSRFVISPSNKDDGDQFTLRLDKRVFSQGNLFGRYTVVNSNVFTPNPFPKLVGLPLRTRFQNLSINYSHALKPTLLSETRLGYNREYTLESAPGLGTNHTVLAGITGFERTSESLPRFPVLGITGLTALDGRSFRPLNNTNDIYQIMQNVAWFRGKHTWKFGTDLRQQRNVNWNAAYNSGVFNFRGAYTQDPLRAAGTGASFTDFLLGLPADATRSFPRDAFGSTFGNYHFFAQDDWRATTSLTVNFGLRWEFNPWPIGYRNQMTSFDRALGKVILASPVNFEAQKIARAAYDAMPGAFVTTDELGLPRQIQHNNYRNFGPRVGIAWRLTQDGRTVLRAGYGIFYDLVNGNARTGAVINPPFLFDETANNNAPVPNRTLRDFFFTQPPSAASPPIIDSRNLNQRSPSEQTWNLAIQRELGRDLALEIAYVGKKGTHLERDLTFNQPDPGPGAVQSRRPFPRFGVGNLRDDGSNAAYHGLQSKLEKRLAHGLTFLASYTFSKSTDDVSNDLGGSVQNWRDFRSEHAVSDFDFTHNFVFSGLYELPIGKGKALLTDTGPVLNRIAGGWQIGGITVQRSGAPFTPRLGFDNAGTGQATQRPNRICSGKLDNPAPEKWFNPADFVIPAQYTFGNSGRNILRGPRGSNFDLVLLKDTNLREAISVQFRFEAFNAFNHVNYGLPNAVVNTATTGRITGAGDPRILQFALKLVY